jgi:hypothetical protein
MNMHNAVDGHFVDEDDDSWFRIDHFDQMPPFFISIASDSDIWAYVSTSGSLAAGRRDAEGSFFPYETVDRIHLRWENTGPRTWIRILNADRSHCTELWQPFTPKHEGLIGVRSVWKNLSSTRLRFREIHPSGKLSFEYEWSSTADMGLIRSARLLALDEPVCVEVLDGVLNLVPPGVSVAHATTMSCLADAYKWNELVAGGRLALYTLYAKIWDRAEPKESFQALVAWHAGLPPGGRVLTSEAQVLRFCRGESILEENLTRGQRGAFLVHFAVDVDQQGVSWEQVIDAPLSQVQVADLADRLMAGEGTFQQIRSALRANASGVDELLSKSDAFQHSADFMAAAHHRSNVLFNIMRGGVFPQGTLLDREQLRAFFRMRNQPLARELEKVIHGWPELIERDQALDLVRATGMPQLERLLLGYMPLTFSRRHGDPSRPWNKFVIQPRDKLGRRRIGYQGNWRDIFQNWEALLASEPAYAGSMIEAFLGAMTADGYNPYRIGHEGIDWELIEPENPWSHIGYWGDHQVIYLQRLLEASHSRDTNLIASFWDKAIFSFADVPYRLRSYAEQIENPKSTIFFDSAADAQARARAQRIGSDGLMLCDEHDHPILATLGEKLITILLTKAGSFIPGGGMWLHTQRPEWNDANNALVGNGVSVVTLAQFRRMLAFVKNLPCASDEFALPSSTVKAVMDFQSLIQRTSLEVVSNPVARRGFVDLSGGILEAWRAKIYLGASGRQNARAPAGLIIDFVNGLLPLVDASLHRSRREDGLFDSYNLIDFRHEHRAELSSLYPMLEGQVAVLSCGHLPLCEAVKLLEVMFASPLYDPVRRSFLLYPDRRLPTFMERNRLDSATLDLPIVQTLLASQRTDLLERQSDGTVRFACQISNRADLEEAGSDLGQAIAPLVDAYERLLGHRAFTGRSGTMFAYEGLGCIYWHMVAKLLLAVQERVFEASDDNAPELPALLAYYRRVRNGLGYKKTTAEYGAFPADPYSHTPSQGGAQQPGMTGQVKEEIITRWGELGIRFESGLIRFDPVLLDPSEIPTDSALRFTLSAVPFQIRRGNKLSIRSRTGQHWNEHLGSLFSMQNVDEVDIELRV